ncbi:hypothetical protein WA026_002542 [Henosepilachna vigintioctopunctata]|uniref:Uncharacterized protein n=1 Tax=Henosepilachna vigintioctopunctata TaxID=420089 RepID=A0AAW1U1Z5_9CUCU
MSYAFLPKVIRITIIVCLLLSIIQGSLLENSETDENIAVRKKPHRRKSARLAFLQETNDPMFKFLNKILNTAQLRSKGALTRAQNGVKLREEFKTEITNTINKISYQ